MLTSSVTVLTLDVSSDPCASVPSPLSPGAPTCGEPLDPDSTRRLLPEGCNPCTLMKFASCTWPTVVAFAAPGAVTETVPSLPTVTDCEPTGMVMAGDSGYPLAVTTLPVESIEK